MSIHNLNALFHPRTVAVVGASNRPQSIGNVVMRNLLEAGFDGPIMPVHPTRDSVCGVLAYPNVASLPVAPDLAVICAPASEILDIIQALGERGARAAVLITALADHTAESGDDLTKSVAMLARRFGMRILGPNSVGLLSAKSKLNASFAPRFMKPGKIAFVSQSGALCTAVLDWAHSHQIGFSHFVSLGDKCDVDFADLLDYLSSEPDVRAILLYIESLNQARKFMSAARATARNKPVLLVKSGRVEEGAVAARSHSGALSSSDDIYDAAFRRAGCLRVIQTEELFEAVETLNNLKPIKGDRLGLITNGGGFGILATDMLVDGGGHLAELSDETMEALNKVLPKGWSKINPVDLMGDADGSRYAEAASVMLKDKGLDALLVMNTPTAIRDSVVSAKALIEAVKRSRKLVLTAWMGGHAAEESRRLFEAAGIPTYQTPEEAVRAFLHVVEYQRNQEILMETPATIPEGFEPNQAKVRTIINAVLDQGRDWLTEAEAKDVFEAYGIPCVKSRFAATPEAAAAVAEELTYPVAVKVQSLDLLHKSDVGGVVLNLEGPEEVRKAAEGIQRRIQTRLPDCRLQGFSVQEMAKRPRALELMAGVTTDKIFGPVVIFGRGGKAVEVIRDRAVAFPPLNMALAKDLVNSTEVSRLLQGYRDVPAADMAAINLTLIQMSQLVIDFPEIVEMDLNPFFADEKGVMAVDGQMRICPDVLSEERRLAIRPYPSQLEETVVLRDGSEVMLRPIKPEDEPAHYDLIKDVSEQDLRFRFFGSVRDFPHQVMARFTQIDYEREMAFVAKDKDDRTLGVVRTNQGTSKDEAEYAILLRSHLKGLGLGKTMMNKIIRYNKDRGMRRIIGEVLKENGPMLGLNDRLGFRQEAIPGERDAVYVILDLEDWEER